MSLSLLAVLVVFGVSLVVGLAHLMGGLKNEKFPDKESAQSRFALDFPEFNPQSVLLSKDHKIALLIGNRGIETGLVVSMGAHSLTRLLNRQSLKSVVENGNLLELRLNDMTLPRVEIAFEQPDSIQAAMARMQSILNTKVET